MAEYIERQAALKAIEDTDTMCDIIRELDNARPHWIPVTERLPEEDTMVLMWRENGIPYVSRRIDSTYWVGLGRDAGITHWMPLPPSTKEAAE